MAEQTQSVLPVQAQMENSMSHPRPENLSERDEQARNLRSRREVDPHVKVYHNRTLLDNLTCSFCQRYLSVAPIFFKNANNNELTKVCGRCYRDPTSQVFARRDKLQKDHIYEQLLPFFVFNCSHKPCDVKLKFNEVEEHEGKCHFRLQTRSGNDEPRDLSEQGVSREKIFVSIPNVKALRKRLSCTKCTKPLSIFPVLSNGTQIICGRCERSGSDWTQQEIYKIMAPFIKFPCNRPSCTQGLKIDEVEEHERTCRSTYILCPSIPCRKSKLLAEMSIHIRQYHLPECRDRLEVKPQTSLFKIDSEPYIVSVVADDDEKLQQFSCKVYGIDEKQYDDLQLEVVDEDDGSLLESLQIQVARMRQTLDPVQIKNPRKPAFLRLVTRENFEGLALDAEARELFECKVCCGYMTRAIFTCENGHPTCDKCKPRVEHRCPMCRATLADDRHWQLETGAAKFKFPCRFRDRNDCRVVLTPKFLGKHEDRCRQRRTDPSSKCFVAGCSVMLNSYRYDEFCNHYAKHHRDGVIFSGSKEVFEWSTEYPRGSWGTTLFFDGEIFFGMFHCGERAGLSFGVSHMAATFSKRYKYTLELHHDGRTVDRKGTCGLLSATTDVHLGPELVEDMLTRGSSTSGWLVYRVKLEEDCQLLRS